MKPQINIYEYPTDLSLLPDYRIAVMQAALEGMQVEAMHSHVWLLVRNGDRLWDWVNAKYRIAKPKKLVPWTLETAPRGYVLHRYKNGSANVRMVLGWFEHGLALASWHQITDRELYGNLLANSEHSLDGGKTWLPCGTEE